MPSLKFYTKPWKHQLEALEFLMPRSYGALYTDMGSGKTKVMIDLIANRGFKKVLVLTTKKICQRRIWETEFNKHYNGNIYNILDISKYASDRKGREVEKSIKLNNNSPIIVVNNYDSVWRKPFREFVLRFGFDCVICDESHRIKGAGSKVSRFLALLGKRVPNRYIMTGTPLAQSIFDIYGQYRFLNPEIYGTRYDVFKHRYGIWINRGDYEVLDKYQNLDEFYENMFSCAFIVPSLDLDLPPVHNLPWKFYLPKKTQKYYKELVKEGVLETKKGNVIATNILTNIIRRQQLTSGYLPTDEGVIKVDEARVEAFRELLEDLPDEPIVVFAKFRKDIKNIRRVVKELGRKSSELSGRRDTSDNWYYGKTNVLVVQISAGAEGIDLTRARFGIYYTKTHALWQYEQSWKRLHRPGQTRSTTFFHLTACMDKGKTIDESINESLEKGQDLIDRVMAGEVYI